MKKKIFACLMLGVMLFSSLLVLCHLSAKKTAVTKQKFTMTVTARNTIFKMLKRT